MVSAPTFFYRFSMAVIKSTSRRRGYIDSFHHVHQEFYRDLLIYFGKKEIKIKRTLLFREEIPQHVVLSGCIGDIGWRTDCPAHIVDKCNRRVKEEVV